MGDDGEMRKAKVVILMKHRGVLYLSYTRKPKQVALNSFVQPTFSGFGALSK